MGKIIPALLVKNEKEFHQKIKGVRPLTKWVQIDVMDGKFVPRRSWADPKKIKQIGRGLNLEVHLMVKNFIPAVKKWLAIGAQMIIGHLEVASLSEISKFISLVKQKGFKAGLAINPSTPLFLIEKFLDKLDLVLVMGVTPGASGQEFQKNALKKIKKLVEWRRQKKLKFKIEVDGGVNLKTIKAIFKAGADQAAAASAIFEGRLPLLKELVKKNFGNLERALRK